jgi:hypothetical protein
MKLSLLMAMTGLLASSTGFAQDYDDWEDSAETVQEVAPATREVVRGSYAKANVGAAAYLGNFSGWVSAGTAVSMGFGQDFIDEEDFSMAWEANFTQGIHNGVNYSSQGAAKCLTEPDGTAPCLQGDLRTYTFTAIVEASTYVRRRIGLGIRLGAGALMSPLLIEETAWGLVVGSEFNGVDPGYHGGVKPLALFGPTFEYYSKLAHFSVGIDADVFYAIGFDLGVNATGYMKYTF